MFKRFFNHVARWLRFTLTATVPILVNVTADVWHVPTDTHLKRIEQHNRVVDVGLALLVSLLANDGATGITHFAVGTGTAEVLSTDTALETEVLRQTVTQRLQSGASLTVKYYLPSTQANGSTLTEVALVNASSGGTVFARALLGETIAKTSAIAVTFTWTITFATA